MTLGEKIKRLRKARKWSQAELARTLDVHVTHVSRLETGRYAPSLELLKKLASVLEVSTDYLLYENATEAGEASLQNKTFYERMRLVDGLGEEDRSIILGVIEAFLTKRQVRDLVSGHRAAG